MSESEHSNSAREQAEIKQIEADTLYKLEEVKSLKDEGRMKKLGFGFRWLIIWLSIGGFIKLEIIQEVAKWING
ncbi:hypothetical protein FG064_16455 [Vibrio cholerae]|uniref:hypothetical protein n=1 Tax=Vibrio cholerae TaxID=666 RepID=UPI001191446F|nr:hypothetical protein [Vibrio cholerae]EII3728693.1 hypothetical protein [Vibrio cholerae]EMA3788861.1 hypothetical protein [Vibrio cholerae]TVN03410.1 hypothetical protein FPV63_12370 [Vibrio cholerae]HAS5006773.1 hypothetical protein [Vibrio cholerae]